MNEQITGDKVLALYAEHMLLLAKKANKDLLWIIEQLYETRGQPHIKYDYKVFPSSEIKRGIESIKLTLDDVSRCIDKLQQCGE